VLCTNVAKKNETYFMSNKLHSFSVSTAVFDTIKHKCFYAVSAHNSKTVGLILIRCYIGSPCTFVPLFYVICKRASEVSIHN
jgi:hypothetical protein